MCYYSRSIKGYELGGGGGGGGGLGGDSMIILSNDVLYLNMTSGEDTFV